MSLFSVLVFFRYLGMPIAFIIYFLFQLIIRKRKWKDLQSDAIVMLVFAMIYYSIIYLIYKGI